MTNYSLGQITTLVSGALQGDSERVITDITFDSRKLTNPEHSVFFALKTARNDGHRFIKSAFEKGVRAFVVNQDFTSDLSASFIKVEHPLYALQRLAESHRNRFKIPVIAITGSNGKTIVKDWLSQIISQKINAAVSPRSYNSQIGVSLSLWQIDPQNELAIIEAGISKPNEMDCLAQMIQPTLGVFTNIGDAHLVNFKDRKQLIKEKAQLFKGAEKVIANSNSLMLINELKSLKVPLHTWGVNESDDVKIGICKFSDKTELLVNNTTVFTISFTDDASIENACHALVTAMVLKIDETTIQEGLTSLESLDMRLQVLKGKNNCTIINDAYSADLKALEQSLNLANNYAHERPKVLIISKFYKANSADYTHIKELVTSNQINRLITIGIDPLIAENSLNASEHFTNVDAFLRSKIYKLFNSEVVIIKGARKFKLEKIAQRLQLKNHQTVLEVNLSAFTANLNYYRTLIKPETKIMAMVKAFSYGSGTYEIARHLESLGVHYLAVAYADEGVELRKKGVKLPILVLNPEPSAFSSIVENNLEPEMYSLSLLRKFKSYLDRVEIENYPIHIKLDTGMHRLGMETSEIQALTIELTSSKYFQVKTIFSHLAASDSERQDSFTKLQIQKLKESADLISAAIGYQPIRHICNTAAIGRFPEAHLDMVRLGIGLYGISSEEKIQNKLMMAGRLKTTIIQVRTIAPGESLGYGRRFVSNTTTKVAVIPIGYADGLFRSLGNGNFHVKLGNQTAPIIGNICMDMAFIDVTQINAQVGQEVSIFSTPEDVSAMAKVINSIPYEVLSAVSYRVKREYYSE
jgi:alanine racemase